MIDTIILSYLSCSTLVMTFYKSLYIGMTPKETINTFFVGFFFAPLILSYVFYIMLKRKLIKD